MSVSTSTPKFEHQFVGYHELDPDGDVVLIFNSKNAIVSPDHEINLVDGWNAIGNAEECEGDQILPLWYRNLVVSGSSSVDSDERSSLSSHDTEQDLKNTRPMYVCGTADLEVRVSSKHLTLVSPVFKALLSENYREGQTLRNDGQVRIPLIDDPIHGMIVLLKLLHFQFEQHDMTPSLLMQIALLADKYDMASKILYWSRLWSADIKDHIPKQWRPEVIRYIGLFSMLKIDDLKEKMIDLARGYVDETISGADLPIDGAIESLQENRKCALKKAFGELENMIEAYWAISNDTKMCKNNQLTCDATILGLLLKSLKNAKFWPLPTVPYPGITIAGVIEHLQKINLPTECERFGGRRDYYRPRLCRCDGIPNIVIGLKAAAKL